MDANELLMSGGIKSAKFETLGDTVIGTITDQPKVEQMRKYQSEELDFWPSGDPKMQIVVILQTEQRDPADPHDDGKRRLHIPPRMMQPVREAVRRSGAKGLEIGGRIAVRWVSGSGQGEGNAKQYAADYAPPAVDPGSLLGGNGAAPVTAPAAAAPSLGVAQPPAAQAPAAPAPSAAAQSLGLAQPAAIPCPPGIDPEKWKALPVAQQQAIAAAMVPAGGQPPF